MQESAAAAQGCSHLLRYPAAEAFRQDICAPRRKPGPEGGQVTRRPPKGGVGEPLFGEDWWTDDQRLFQDSLIRRVVRTAPRRTRRPAELAGDDRPGEGYLGKAGRLGEARHRAEQIVWPEDVLLRPEPGADDETDSPDRDLLWGLELLSAEESPEN